MLKLYAQELPSSQEQLYFLLGLLRDSISVNPTSVPVQQCLPRSPVCGAVLPAALDQTQCRHLPCFLEGTDLARL